MHWSLFLYAYLHFLWILISAECHLKGVCLLVICVFRLCEWGDVIYVRISLVHICTHCYIILRFVSIIFSNSSLLWQRTGQTSGLKFWQCILVMTLTSAKKGFFEIPFLKGREGGDFYWGKPPIVSWQKHLPV